MKTLNVRFIPLQSVSRLNYDPGAGGSRNDHSPEFEYDDESRAITYEVRTGGPQTLCTLPEGWDAILADTQEPAVNFIEWFVGKAEDIAELRKALDSYCRAKARLVRLLANGNNDG